MKKPGLKLILGLVALCAVLAVISLNRKSAESSTDEAAAVPSHEDAFLAPTPEMKPEPIKSVAAASTPTATPKSAGRNVEKKAADAAPTRPLKDVTPNLAAIREEVAKNPHETPKALMAFSVSLSDRLQAALSSESESEKFFGELESCTQEQKTDGSRSIAALCIVNARRLADKHPSLKQRYTELEASADKKALALSKTVN